MQRRERERAIGLRFEHQETTWTARVVEPATSDPPQAAAPASLPAGLALVSLPSRADAAETPTVPVHLQANGAQRTEVLPRRGLQRLCWGHPAPAGTDALEGLVPPPAELAQAAAWMVWAPHLPVRDVPGEEDPLRLASALQAASLPVVLGVGTEAADRWASAPRIQRAQLLAPPDAFPGATAPLRQAVEAAWGKLPVAASLTGRKAADLVVLVSAEAPAVLAARAAELAGDPRLAGRHLAVLSLAGPPQTSLADTLLGRGPAGVAVAEANATDVQKLAAAVAGARRGVRAEALGGPGIWTYGVSGSRPPARAASPASPPSPSPPRSRR